MHILASTSSSLDDIAEPVDLNQPVSDVLFLSFSPSDLSGFSAVWDHRDVTLGVVQLSELRHPFSVDLWIEKTASHAKVILLRVLGGHSRWSYGVSELQQVACQNKVQLIMLPGECSQSDEVLAAASTIERADLDGVLACFREGGSDNLALIGNYLAALARGETVRPAVPRPAVRNGYYLPGTGPVEPQQLLAALPAQAARVPILFYRSLLLADDAAPIDALFAALVARGFAPLPIFVSGLKDAQSLEFVSNCLQQFDPAVIITATAFASGAAESGQNLFDAFAAPVFQVILATTAEASWRDNQRGLNPADLAMHIVLPELDGRILAGSLSFKAPDAQGLARNQVVADRVALVADRIAAQIRLQDKPREQRKLIILIPDYPSAPGRTGYAVGLDVPESVRQMLMQLQASGYAVSDIPTTARALLDRLDHGLTYPLSDYRRHFDSIDREAAAKVTECWGDAATDDDVRAAAFHFRAAQFGNVTIALAPDRGRTADRRANYHDPALPPRHALLAFGGWLRRELQVDALVHVGAHGAIEWLPGKVVALSQSCFPELVLGALPVIYPFIVSNPGEAAVAKRRIAAITLGHLPPALQGNEFSAEQKQLELLADEYAQADGLDRNRRDRLARLIVDQARINGIANDAGVSGSDDAETALTRIDAYLCDLKDFSYKDGQHIFGTARADELDTEIVASAQAEAAALIRALDGYRIAAGPSGAPARGRRDVLPTGRNLYAADPRSMPTPTAYELGQRAAEEVLRRHLQEQGDWPKSILLDLWGSASLRNGGEDVAQALALMGARPVWDPATGRVTGVEVLPPARLGRPRIDISIRMSGLFRDMFPALIALLDTTIRAIANRQEAAGDNPLAEVSALHGTVPPRLFGSAPGTYGAGIEEALASGQWDERADLGNAYLAMTSHTFFGHDGEAAANPAAFADVVRQADLLVHSSDDPGRDILDGSADVAFIGGFAAAVALLGGKADIVALDTSNPERLRARSVSEAVTRVVRGRATNQKFIAGQMRHGPRGAAELVETVDRLIGFAETTEAIAPQLIEALFDAYLGDETVRQFLLQQNPVGLDYMIERFRSARRRNLWPSQRNSIEHLLDSLGPASGAVQ